MDLSFFELHQANPATLLPAILKQWRSSYELKTYKEYNTETHRIVTDKVSRPDKIVRYPSSDGSVDFDGNPVMLTNIEYVARIAIPLQKLIVKRAVAFLTGGRVTLDCRPDNAAEQTLFDYVVNAWTDNKLQYKNGEIAKAMMSQTECAEIWRSEIDKDGKVKLRCRIYKPEDGYDLIPVFDNHGDLIAFGLQWQDSVNTRTRYFDLYTDKLLTHYQNTGSGWVLREGTKDLPNPYNLPYGKIPVIYYSQPRSEWADVQTMIERLETLVSNYADTNDYNGSPILFAKGEIKGFAKKGEAGKMIESEGDGADLKYVEIGGKPEAVIYEKDTLLDFIYSSTQTPNLSFEAMKGLGDISGVAFERIMIDAHLKAIEQHNGQYGECIQRRLNFLIAACAEAYLLTSAAALRIAPKFSLFKINDQREAIDNAIAANGGNPVIDRLGAIRMAGLTDDADATFAAIKADASPDPVTPQ